MLDETNRSITKPARCTCLYLVGPSNKPLRFARDGCPTDKDLHMPVTHPVQDLTAEELLDAIGRATLGKSLGML